MDYEDFVIQLGADDRDPTVRVVRSPTGETETERLSLDLSDSEIVSLATAFGRAAEAARRDRHLAANDDLPEPPVSEIGARLFRALFPGTVRDLYQQSLGRVAARDQGLRIRIGVGLRSRVRSRSSVTCLSACRMTAPRYPLHSRSSFWPARFSKGAVSTLRRRDASSRRLGASRERSAFICCLTARSKPCAKNS